MSSGVTLDGTDSNGVPSSISAEAALSAALGYVTVTEPGGTAGKLIPDALAAKSNLGHTAAPDADYQALATDVQIGFPVLTAQRTVFFPDVDTYPLGQDFVVADESGQCSPTRPLLMAPGPGTNDVIGDGTPIAITGPNQGLRFRRGRTNLWILV